MSSAGPIAGTSNFPYFHDTKGHHSHLHVRPIRSGENIGFCRNCRDVQGSQRLYAAKREMMKMLRFRLTAMLLFGLFYTHPSSDAQTPPPQGQPKAPAASATAAAEEQLSPEEKKKRKDWNESMLHKPVPKKGCFNAAVPTLEWREGSGRRPPPHTRPLTPEWAHHDI